MLQQHTIMLAFFLLPEALMKQRVKSLGYKQSIRITQELACEYREYRMVDKAPRLPKHQSLLENATMLVDKPR